jgi:hypothetical protein
MLFPIIIHYYSQPTRPTSSIQLPAPVLCLFIAWCSPTLNPFWCSALVQKLFNLCPTALQHPPLRGFLRWITISEYFQLLLSSLWFLNWKYSWVPPSVTQKSLVVLIRYHPASAVSNLEGTYKHPCTSRPLLKKNFFSFSSFCFTIPSLLCEFTPHIHFVYTLSSCVAKRF